MRNRFAGLIVLDYKPFLRKAATAERPTHILQDVCREILESRHGNLTDPASVPEQNRPAAKLPEKETPSPLSFVRKDASHEA